MIRDFFHTPPCTIIAAGPETVAPHGGSGTNNSKKPCPLCLGEALKRFSIENIKIFMVRE